MKDFWCRFPQHQTITHRVSTAPEYAAIEHAYGLKNRDGSPIEVKTREQRDGEERTWLVEDRKAVELIELVLAPVTSAVNPIKSIVPPGYWLPGLIPPASPLKNNPPRRTE